MVSGCSTSGSTVLWPLTLAATPARGQGPWAFPCCGGESTAENTLGTFLRVKDCWGGQVRERSGSLGSPLEAQLNILVIFLAFSP